jgi:hypothetical protein
MAYYFAGREIKLRVDFMVDGAPVVPDEGTAILTLLFRDGTTLINRDDIDVPTDSTRGSYEIPASMTEIETYSEPRFIYVEFDVDGVTHTDQFGFYLIPFVPIVAQKREVRALIGLSATELPDRDIDLLRAYQNLLARVGDALSTKLTGTGPEVQKANLAILYQAAADILPGIQVRVIQTEKIDSASYSRQQIDVAVLTKQITDQLDELVEELFSTDETDQGGVFFALSTPADPITGA